MPRKKSTSKRIQIGNKTLRIGGNGTVSFMPDSNDLYDAKDFTRLRLRLETEGYIFVRGVIPKGMALRARKGMLTQANEDGSIDTSKGPFGEGRIMRKGSKWAGGYCLDGVTGAETGGREGIDVPKWNKLGSSKEFTDVYDGESLREFWTNLFGKGCQPLVKQTFLRLMGVSGTIEHADYYYFKKDTDVFSGDDGMNAMKASEDYLKENKLWEPSIHTTKLGPKPTEKRMGTEKLRRCSICECLFYDSQVGKEKTKLLETQQFGVLGEWHCPLCAIRPLAVYTTWIPLSNLKPPKDSILAVAPGTHKLTGWDMPQRKAQVPGDFHWKLPWVIPQEIGPGDIIIFNIKTVHAASFNSSSPRCFRVSFDTRLRLGPSNSEEESTAMVSSSNNSAMSTTSSSRRRQSGVRDAPELSRGRRRRGRPSRRPSKATPHTASKVKPVETEQKEDDLESDGDSRML